MKLRIKIDPEENQCSFFSPDAVRKLESVFEKELPLLCRWSKIYAEAEVSVSFLDRTEMRYVNKQYRGLDEPTDVLAFPLWDQEENSAPPAPFIPLPLGDIVICAEEAEQEHVPMSRLEALCLVLAHGFLHLLGWDHDTDEKEASMWERQELLKSRLLDAMGKVS